MEYVFYIPKIYLIEVYNLIKSTLHHLCFVEGDLKYNWELLFDFKFKELSLNVLIIN